MYHTTHRFLLRLPHMGRQISDEYWQQVEPYAAQQLKVVERLLNTSTINVEHTRYNFKFDFQPVWQSYLDKFNKHKKFEETHDWDIWRYSSTDSTDCYIECDVAHPEKPIMQGHCQSILEYVMYETFTAMSVCVPGVFNLDGAEFIDIPEKRSVYGSVITHNISTSAYLLENCLYEIKALSWLPDTEVSAEDVFLWLQKVSPRFTMLGDNPANRCIFAILHLCKGDPYAGASAAWLFNAFESLFGSGPGENRAALVRRIGHILALNDADTRHLKKEIGNLYDLRSAFVHGGLPTIHPVRDESLDKRVDDEALRLMRAMDKGMAILIAVIRNIVHRRIDWPRFEDRLIN